MPDTRTVAVIGAGVMGRGIAHLAALGGYCTILEDILPSSLRRAEEEFRNILDQAIASETISRSDAEAAVNRLQYASSVEEAAREADLVIEAVPDEWESKSEIFILLDKICKPETVLVTNTSALSVNEIASVTYRPRKILGMRFENPVHKMTKIELVPGLRTDSEAVAACNELAMRMGKDAVVIRDSVSGDMDPSG
jgi:3-hydroxybutyryl-CoA dehydrogenase